MAEKLVSILGSTGSIGTQSLDVCKRLGYRVTALAANSNVKLLEAQCREFRPASVCIGEKDYVNLKTALADTDIKVFCGDEGLAELAYSDAAPTLVNAVLGMKGLLPTLEAARAGKRIAFANKETLVAGGKLVTDAVKKHGAALLPVDSEHSAIFQCIQNGGRIKKIILIGSGGPFLGKDRAFLETVTPEMAVRHPKWNMGKKISVDSASLMNKGLELIEAMHLFDVRPEQIEIAIHPQSAVHSLVEFEDNAVLAQFGVPDMRLCIQYALTYPERLPSPVAEFDIFGDYSFKRPDTETFPLLALARAAAVKGGNIPAAMNGANEEAVRIFLDGKITFTKMFSLVEDATENARFIKEPSLDDVLATDALAREYVAANA